jgi:hypothetical protein
MALLQVPGDGGRAGLVPVPVEVLAQGNNLLLHGLGGAPRAGMRPP